jgi:hypothetical protein
MAIDRQTRLAVLAAFAFLLAAACSPAPGPSGSPSPVASQSAAGTALPIGELADSPPSAVQAWLAAQPLGIGFRPLTVSELALVRVSAAAAESRALAEPAQGYGEDGGKIVWTKVGCIFLGYYVGPQFSNHGNVYVPPQLPAYLVQIIGAPAPGFPGDNIQVVVLDAETGARVTAFGGGKPVVLGTTCGVSP